MHYDIDNGHRTDIGTKVSDTLVIDDSLRSSAARMN